MSHPSGWDHPVGTSVIVKTDVKGEWQTRTRSVPWQLGDGTWVISLEGRVGGWNLERVFLAEGHKSPLLFPREITEPVREVLSLMIMATCPTAHVLRIGGTDIPTKTEDEQAHVLHWLLCLALEHGEKWREIACARLAEIKAANLEAQPA